MLSAQRIKVDTNITTSISSAEEIANNDDLLIELFLRLPIRSLLKFKCVSKHWLSLISNPNFSVRLNLIPRPTSGLFLRNGDSSGYEFINLNSDSSRAPFELLIFDNDLSRIIVLQSCNGLLWCYSLKVNNFSSFLDMNFFNTFYVFNPTTKQCIMLPPLPPRTGFFRAVPGVYLAFDPLKSSHYKVIFVRSTFDSVDATRYEILIYSSNTGGWKLSGNTFLGPMNLTLLGGVYCNGAIHWINVWHKCLYLDIEEEKAGEMPMPPIPDGFEDRNFCYFGESRGHLHPVEIYSSPTVQFKGYEIEKDYSRWFVKYQVDLHGVVTAFREILSSYNNPQSSRFSILCVVREENES